MNGFAYSIVASALHDAPSIDRILAPVTAELERLGIRGRFAPGPVTLLRLGGDRLERHWFAEGRVEGAGDAPDLCRTQVTVHVDAALDGLLSDPLGNHLVMVAGHHRRRLERWWDLAFPR